MSLKSCGSKFDQELDRRLWSTFPRATHLGYLFLTHCQLDDTLPPCSHGARRPGVRLRAKKRVQARLPETSGFHVNLSIVESRVSFVDGAPLFAGLAGLPKGNNTICKALAGDTTKRVLSKTFNPPSVLREGFPKVSQKRFGLTPRVINNKPGVQPAWDEGIQCMGWSKVGVPEGSRSY